MFISELGRPDVAADVAAALVAAAAAAAAASIALVVVAYHPTTNGDCQAASQQASRLAAGSK